MKEFEKSLQHEIALKGKSSFSDILERLGNTTGIEMDDEYPETNGWEIDYWKSFKYKGKPFCLSGSMYYGTYKIYEEES